MDGYVIQYKFVKIKDRNMFRATRFGMKITRAEQIIAALIYTTQILQF